MVWKTGKNDDIIIMRDDLKITFIPICKGGKMSALIEKNLQSEEYIEINFEYNDETYLTDFIKDYEKISFKKKNVLLRQ